MRRGNFEGGQVMPIVKYRENRPCTAAIEPFVKSICLFVLFVFFVDCGGAMRAVIVVLLTMCDCSCDRRQLHDAVSMHTLHYQRPLLARLLLLSVWTSARR